jgi:integrase
MELGYKWGTELQPDTGGVMAKVRLTAGRIAEFECAAEKVQDFLWCEECPGLGVRVTPLAKGKKKATKKFIFQSKLKRDVIRITIGDVDTYGIKDAQRKANVYRAQIDAGEDPRLIRADQLASAQAERDERAQEEAAEREAADVRALRESVTLEVAWNEYVKERSPRWSAHHLTAHGKMIQAGGQVRRRSPKPTTAGPLAGMAKRPLVDLTVEHIEEWAKLEALVRPASARLALRLLKAFLNWCCDNKQYAQLVATNAAKSRKAREVLGKPKVKNDVLQREQLEAWFSAVRQIGNPVIAAYLQCLLLIGPRREELATLRWRDVDFNWNSLRLRDKVEDSRAIPLTPYVSALLKALPRRNDWVFSSTSAESGHIAEPRIAHNAAVAAAGLPPLTLHGLRRSFASLSEWTETPAGVAAQIQGHAPQGVREQNYIRRPLDLLRMWHVKIEEWMLDQAGIVFSSEAAVLKAVA